MSIIDGIPQFEGMERFYVEEKRMRIGVVMKR